MTDSSRLPSTPAEPVLRAPSKLFPRSPAIPIGSEEFGASGHHAAAASLLDRASDAALRDYLMWRRVGSPLVSDNGDSPRAKASSRSPSPTTVTFDLAHKLDGEDVLFALDV